MKHRRTKGSASFPAVAAPLSQTVRGNPKQNSSSVAKIVISSTWQLKKNLQQWATKNYFPLVNKELSSVSFHPGGKTAFPSLTTGVNRRQPPTATHYKDRTARWVRNTYKFTCVWKRLMRWKDLTAGLCEGRAVSQLRPHIWAINQRAAEWFFKKKTAKIKPQQTSCCFYKNKLLSVLPLVRKSTTRILLGLRPPPKFLGFERPTLPAHHVRCPADWN